MEPGAYRLIDFNGNVRDVRVVTVSHLDHADMLMVEDNEAINAGTLLAYTDSYAVSYHIRGSRMAQATKISPEEISSIFNSYVKAFPYSSPFPDPQVTHYDPHISTTTAEQPEIVFCCEGECDCRKKYVIGDDDIEVETVGKESEEDDVSEKEISDAEEKPKRGRPAQKRDK